MKGKVCKSYMSSAILYGRRAWYLTENEVTILGNAERSMVRAMCCLKLVDKRKTVELMDMLELKEAGDKLARLNSVKWYCYVLRQLEGDVFMKAMVHEVIRKHEQSQPRIK